MSDDGMNLSRRKVLGGITTVGAASAAAGAGTFALFSSNQDATGTISTGTVQLGSPTVTNLDATLGSDGTLDGTVELSYSGTLDADLFLGMEITEGSEPTITGNADKSASDLAKQLYLDSDTAISVTRPADAPSTLNDHTDYVLQSNQKTAEDFTDLALESDGSEATLNTLNSNLQVSNNEADTEIGPIVQGDMIKVRIKALAQNDSGGDLGNAFQGESINVKVYAMAQEKTSSS